MAYINRDWQIPEVGNNPAVNPDVLISEFPCLNCATIQQLYVILLGMFMIANGTSDDISAVEEAAAKNRSLSEKEFLQGLIASLPDAWFDQLFEEDGVSIRQAFYCLACYPPATIRAMFLNQWYTYWNTAQ